jgi:hypothetical protein
MISNDVVVPQPLAVPVATVTPLVETFREIGKDAKLEVRLGFANPDGNWETGVSKDSFNEILDMFLRYEGWDDASSEWDDIHDYMYRVPHTLGDDARMRTSVELTSRLILTHVIKQYVDMVELRMRSYGRARVVLKKEMDVCGKMLPETVTPDMVLLKKQRCFTRGAWCFTLTQVWRGSSRSDAEQAQTCNKCKYEVSVQFVPPNDYWENARHTSTYVATSLLMKMVDVLSDEMVGCDVVNEK